MVEKRVKTEIDEYGMIDVRTETIAFDPLSAKPEVHQAVGEFIQQDDVALVMDLLDRTERDIVEFWTSQGLPGEVSRGDHPARHVNAASQLGRSWAMWRTLQEARLALAAGEPHHVFRYAWCLATINAEVRKARRHGHDARDGRGRKAARSAGGRSPKLDEDTWKPILRENARLRRDHPGWSRQSRAKWLAKRFPERA